VFIKYCENKPPEFLYPGIQILVNEYVTADCCITNVPHNRLLLKRPLDCPIIVKNRVNVVTDEVRSSIV